MTIRTEEQLLARLDNDLIWRKREITTLRWLLGTAGPDRRDPLLRSTVALVYAHWEGFVKAAGSAYLEFVHYRRLKLSELAPQFVALVARAVLRRGDATSKIAAHLAITTFFLSGLDERAEIPYRAGVDTAANLSSSTLREIIDTLGLDFTPFEIKRHIIDERLLRSRNTIAHGEYLILDPVAVNELAGEVLGMLDSFREQILDAAVMGAYRA